ncbi:type IV pilin [Natrialba sp. SSL1]|uniref:type IV pilin n=1 Tax=Natrialba sp. SSL1 TaxID=1869245 RepID=UPI000A019C6F|nr:type IV pilin N-terminal domain-containing protein [Natrialba sp. SSL1]
MVFTKKLVGNKDERAVSPVIGVILMVAITVILAAVIAAFVLDLGGSVGQEAQAGVTIDVDESDQHIQVEVTSLGNADHVDIQGLESGEINSSESELTGLSVGDTVRIGDEDDGADVHLEAAETDNAIDGTVTAVAELEEDATRTQVGSEDFDFNYS